MTTQENTLHKDIIIRSILKLDLLYYFQLKMEKLYLVSQKKKKSLGAVCGSDHEVFIAKFSLKLKEVGKTTRPFRCDLNQIPYDYTVEVTIRFKGLDLVECLKNYGWRFKTSYRKQGEITPQQKKCKKAEWLSKKTLQKTEKRRKVKGE